MSQVQNLNYNFIATVTGDAGGAITPDGGNLDIPGGHGIVTTGTLATHQLEIKVDGNVATQYDTDAGSATPAANILDVLGGTNMNSAGATNVVMLNLDDTITLTRVNATTFDTNVVAAGVTLSGTSLVADGTDANININITPQGAGNVIVSTLSRGVLQSTAAGIISSSEGGNGELLIASGTGPPIWANLAHTDGSITITNGANTINIEGTDATTTQDGVVELATDAEAIAGTDSVRAIVPTSLKAKLGTQTNHGVLVGAGTTTAVTALAVGITNQVLLGATGADPTWGAVDLTTDVTGILPVPNGGTGLDTMTDHAILLGSGANDITPTAVGATGEGIMGATGADPTWTNSPSFGGTVTAATGMTITTNDLDISSGKLNLPATSATDGQITINAIPIFHTYGTNNLFVGNNSGNFTTTGVGENVGVGTSALNDLTSGTYNTVMGFECGDLITTGTHNTAMAVDALGNLLTGTHNTAVGVGTGGFGSGYAYTGAESSNALLANVGVIGETNILRLGTDGSGAAQQNKAYIAGTYGVTPVGTLNVALVDSNHQLGSVAALGVANGGTGVNSITAHALIVGDTANPINEIAVGGANTVLLGNAGADPTWGAVDLTTDITGTLPVGNGGTGVDTILDHSVVLGSGAGAISATAVGANGQVLVGSATADPVFVSIATTDSNFGSVTRKYF